MKLLSSFLALGLSYCANAWLNETQNPEIWVTITTDIFTTFCPSETQFAYGSKTYSATASQFVTITDCPCTFSQKFEPTGAITPIPNTSSTHSTILSFSNLTAVPSYWKTITETVNEFTTYVSSSTELIHNSRTYTVTIPKILTITNCPCTISRTVPGTTDTTTNSVSIDTHTNSVPTTMSLETNPVSSAGSTTSPAFSSPSLLSPSNLSKSSPVTAPQVSAFSLSTISRSNPSATTTQPFQITGNVAVRTHTKPVALAFAFFAAILF